MNGIFDIPRPITTAAIIHARAINEKNRFTRVDKNAFYPVRIAREKNIVTRGRCEHRNSQALNRGVAQARLTASV